MKLSALPSRPIRRVCTGVCVALAIGSPAALAAPSTTSRHTSAQRPSVVRSAVVELINRERTSHGLHKLSLNEHLVRADIAHSTRMERADELTHQARGESALPTRVTRAGYHRWSWLGENIGYGSSLTLAGALGIVRAWYYEKPPNDGHRANLLNRHYRNLGVGVVLDRHDHRLWLTVDFGRH